MTGPEHAPPPPGDGLDRAGCRRFENGAWRDFTDTVSPEVSIQLYWPGNEPVTLWAYPDKLEELALGHALVELCRPGDVPELQKTDGDIFHLTPKPAPGPVMGAPDRALRPEEIIASGHQQVFDVTGASHAAAVFDRQGELIVLREDIGRHNCIDRLAGWTHQEGVAPASGVIFLTARVTASLAEKLANAGFRAVISRSAVTTAGVEIARHRRMTLAGFARPGRFSVFTDRTSRILDRNDATKAETDA